MKHVDHISLSWREFLANKSLFGVLLLSAVAAMALVFLFVVLDLVLLLVAFPGAMESPELLLSAFLSPGVFVPAMAILLVEALLILIVDAFFTAGFYGMAKNVVMRGKTRFSQFFPEAKMFFVPMLLLQLIRTALILVFAIPFAVALYPVLTSGADIAAGQIIPIVVTVLIFVLALLIISILLIYGEVALVLRNLSAWGAVKETIAVVKNHFGTTLFMVFLMALIMICIGLVQTLLTAPFDTLAKSTGVLWWSGISGFFSLVFNIIFIAAGIVMSLYIIHVYLALVSDKPVRKARKKARS